VEVRYDEELATHVGPELCVAAREDVCEASAGGRAGQPLSHDSCIVLGADMLLIMEGNTTGCVIASDRAAQRGQRPWHVRTLLVREPGDLQSDLSQHGQARIGEARSRSR
jgi:hypothetical protein